MKYVFLIEDYIVWKLTGVRQIDYSLAARTMAFDIASLDFSEEMLVNAGIDRSLFSEPVPIGTPAGRVLPGAAERSGLRPETVIVSCAHDQVAAAVGAGAFDTDILVDGAGTVECMTPVFAGLPDPDVMYDGYYSAVPYVIPGTYVCYAFSYTGGALIQWCAEMLAGKEQALAKERGIPVYGLLEDEYRQMEDSGRRRAGSPTGLLVLPHFAGAATPYMDTGSKGAILGLTTETTAADIYRACEEGVVYEMILNREHLAGSGLSCRKIHATGGGARSKVWMQMKADMLGLPVTALATPDAGTVGCAMLTGIASGIFRSFSDAAAHMVEETETYEPIPARHEKYLQVYEQYRKVYAAVRPLMGDMPAGAPADGGESRG